VILASIDFETTGTNVVKDHPIEYGGVLYSTTQHKCLDNQGMLIKSDLLITAEITRITNITKPALDRFGYDNEEVLPIVLQMIEAADAVIGYNCRRFDYHILYEWVRRNKAVLPEKPWIDLFYDMPWQTPTGKLGHVAADHGILNLFPHSALSDCQTVLAIAQKYDENLLLQRSQMPTVVLRSTAERSQNDLVKQAKFRWNPGAKIWWKPCKEQDADEIIHQCPFPVMVDKNYTQEELDN
jgi:DNA polymerase III alpha subunit (gram-positive type)